MVRINSEEPGLKDADKMTRKAIMISESQIKRLDCEENNY